MNEDEMYDAFVEQEMIEAEAKMLERIFAPSMRGFEMYKELVTLAEDATNEQLEAALKAIKQVVP